MTLSQIVVETPAGDIGFVRNDRGVIDATARYHTAQYMAGGPAAWSLAAAPHVVAIILHHWAGWYGSRLTAAASPWDELQQLDALAAHHRQAWGIGPGYNVVVFPSGRVWAVGKHGTHRAHTKGRHPESRENWNVVGRGVVVAGNYEVEPVTHQLELGIRKAISEVRSWPGVVAGAVVHEHGLTPTVNSAGVMFSQGTLCPGRHIATWRAEGGLNGDTQTDRFDEGWAAGWGAAYGRGAAYAADRFGVAHGRAATEVARAVEAPPPSPPAPGGGA
jgi:hypothetical protein